MFIKLFLIALPTFFVIDMVWLLLVTYATYDLTNLATLKDWPVIVTVIDLIWGMVLAGSISVITYFISTKIG